MSILHDPINNVSVRLSRDESGQLNISIKSSEYNPAITYNNFALRAVADFSPNSRMAIHGGVGCAGGNPLQTKVVCPTVDANGTLTVTWDGVGGSGGGGQYGATAGSLYYSVPQGVEDVTVVSGAGEMITVKA